MVHACIMKKLRTWYSKPAILEPYASTSCVCGSGRCRETVHARGIFRMKPFDGFPWEHIC